MTLFSLDRGPAPAKHGDSRLAMILLVLIAIAAAYWLSRSQGDIDSERIAYERSKRYVQAASGVALAGTPDLAKLPERLAAKGLKQGAPVLIRIFKREFELELWLAREGKFEHFVTYPICMWSGKLGPKLKTGDHQAPEGFYSVAKDQLNPNSKYFRSFNLGFPNAYDRGLGRTGSALMVHGACASVGCYAMTDAQMGEIWTLVTAALQGGQPAFQVQIYPFRMSQENIDAYRGHPNEPFWRDLAAGHGLFEQTRLPPTVSACRGRYAFEAGSGVLGGGPIAKERCPQTSVRTE